MLISSPVVTAPYLVVTAHYWWLYCLLLLVPIFSVNAFADLGTVSYYLILTLLPDVHCYVLGIAGTDALKSWGGVKEQLKTNLIFASCLF